MKTNIFPIPIFKSKIDLKKVKLINKGFERTFISNNLTSHNYRNTLDKDSEIYLLSTIAKLLEEQFTKKFSIKLLSIWENVYKKEDYQEPHMHSHSSFSFIIYKDIKKVNTLFMHPCRYLLESFYKFELFYKYYSPECKKGDLILFPSFLEHMVKKHSNSKTIAGNIWFEYVD